MDVIGTPFGGRLRATHSTSGVVTHETAIAAAVEAGVGPGVGAEVTVATALWYTALSRVNRQSSVGVYGRTQIRAACQVSGTENETVWNAACSHLEIDCWLCYLAFRPFETLSSPCRLTWDHSVHIRVSEHLEVQSGPRSLRALRNVGTYARPK